MARTIICFLIIPLSFIIGRYIKAKYSERTKLLTKIKLMIKEIKSSLSFEGLPTAEIIERLKLENTLSELSFLEDVSLLLTEKAPFPIAWEKGLAKRKPHALKPQDIEILSALGEILGAFNEETQLMRLSLLEAKTDELLDSSKEEEKTKGALEFKLSVFAGITLCILAV